MVREPYQEEEVAEGIWQFSGSHGWGSGVNAVAFVSGKRAVVVDNLYRPGDARRMVKRIESWGVEPIALVNTHWHTDHTIGNCLYRCPIWAHVTGPKLLKEHWPKWVGSPRDKRAGVVTAEASRPPLPTSDDARVERRGNPADSPAGTYRGLGRGLSSRSSRLCRRRYRDGSTVHLVRRQPRRDPDLATHSASSAQDDPSGTWPTLRPCSARE
jgi:hypothetical protein